MGGMRGFFRGLEKSRKKQVIFFSVSMAMVFFIYLVCMKHINKLFEVCNDNFSCVIEST